MRLGPSTPVGLPAGPRVRPDERVVVHPEAVVDLVGSTPPGSTTGPPGSAPPTTNRRPARSSGMSASPTTSSTLAARGAQTRDCSGHHSPLQSSARSACLPGSRRHLAPAGRPGSWSQQLGRPASAAGEPAVRSAHRSRIRPAGRQVVSCQPPAACSPAGSRVATVSAPPRSKANTWSAAGPGRADGGVPVNSSGRSRRSRSARLVTSSFAAPSSSTSGNAAAVDPRQQFDPAAVVDRPPVVRIDQRQVPEFGALVDVRDTGTGELDQLGGQRVRPAERAQPVGGRARSRRAAPGRRRSASTRACSRSSKALVGVDPARWRRPPPAPPSRRRRAAGRGRSARHRRRPARPGWPAARRAAAPTGSTRRTAAAHSCGQLGDHRDPGPDVLRPFGVVGRQRGHACPGCGCSRSILHLMQLLRSSENCAGSPPTSVSEVSRVHR